MREIDEILDAKDEAEEGPLEDPEMDDDDGNDTTLDASQIATLDGSDQDDVVALSDGTQVTFRSISINMHPISKALKNLNSSLPLDKQLSNFASLQAGSLVWPKGSQLKATKNWRTRREEFHSSCQLLCLRYHTQTSEPARRLKFYLPWASASLLFFIFVGYRASDNETLLAGRKI